jgi:hypothetical protein
MSRPLSILLAMSCLIAVTSIARAESPGEQGELGEPVTTNVLGSFQTPSKNIACELRNDIYKQGSEAVLRCNVSETANPMPPKPKDCDLYWGNDFEMTDKGTPELDCYTETVTDAALPVLGYGEVWQMAGFTCNSDQTGLTCINPLQHGFRLSRAKQDVF